MEKSLNIHSNEWKNVTVLVTLQKAQDTKDYNTTMQKMFLCTKLTSKWIIIMYDFKVLVHEGLLGKCTVAATLEFTHISPAFKTIFFMSYKIVRYFKYLIALQQKISALSGNSFFTFFRCFILLVSNLLGSNQVFLVFSLITDNSLFTLILLALEALVLLVTKAN